MQDSAAPTTDAPNAEAPAPDAAETAAPAGFSPASAPMGDEVEVADWKPPQTDEQGFAIDGHGLPVNLRLRAGAMVDQGLDEDPAGFIDADRLAAEVERLAAYDKDYPKVAANSKTADLERIAKAESVDLSAAANNADRVALIEAARPRRV